MYILILRSAAIAAENVETASTNSQRMIRKREPTHTHTLPAIGALASGHGPLPVERERCCGDFFRYVCTTDVKLA